MDTEKITEQILEELGLSLNDTISQRSKLLAVDTIECLILAASIKEASSLLEVSENSLEQTLRRQFAKKIGKDNKEKWDLYLLSLVHLRKCPRCLKIKSLDLFTKVATICKECDNMHSKEYRDNNLDKCKSRSSNHYYLNKANYLARNAKRRAHKLNATPSWSDLEKIKQIYINCPEGYHVDHIVPLQGELVCGLHVENNLQYLTAEDNLKKSNKFIGV